MESIKQTLKQMTRFNRTGQAMEPLLNKLKQQPAITKFLSENPEAEEDLFSRYLAKAYEVMEAQQHCDHCPGLERCPNVLPGHQPHLIYDKGSITVTYQPCYLKRQADQQKRQQSLIKSYYVPKAVLKASFQTIDVSSPERSEALKEAGRFVERYLENPKLVNGLYLHGDFGVGKTYIMGAVLNRLAERARVESLMIYTPDFFREIKNAIQDQTVEEKLDYIRKVPLLVLDDIGAESMSPWIRDEVLGSILQRRMMDQLPTLFTSNYDLEELEAHLAYSNKSGTELLKARRLMERIRHYTVDIFISGKNRRSMNN